MPVMHKGRYTLIVDVIWNQAADLESDYKQVNLRMFTGEKTTLTRIESEKGF